MTCAMFGLDESVFVCFGLLVLIVIFVCPIVALVWVWRLGRQVEKMQGDLDGLSDRVAGRAMARPPGGQPLPPPLVPAVRVPERAVPVVPPPAVPRPVEPAVAPAPARPMRPVELEAFLGLKGLAWAGVIVLLFGVALLAKYLALGLVGRVVAEAACGLVLLAGGEVLARKDYRMLSRVCIGGGLAMEYFAAFSATALYHLLPVPVAWAAMAAVTAAAILLAVRHDSLTVAILAVVGGLAAPILIQPEQDPGHMMFVYLLVVNAAVLVLAYGRKWRLLNLLALVGTVADCSMWLMKYYWGGDLGVLGGPPAVEKLPFVVTYLTLLWAMFVAVGLVYHVLGRRDPSPLDLPVTILNITAYYSALYWLLRADYHDWLGPIAVTLAGVYLFNAAAIRRWRPQHLAVMALNAAQAIALVTLAVPIALEGLAVPSCWAVEATVLVYIGCVLRDRWVRGAGMLVHVAAVGALVYFHSDLWSAGGWVALNGRTVTMAVVGLAAGVSAWLWRRVGDSQPDDELATHLGVVAGHAVLMVMIVLEAQRWRADACAGPGDPHYLSWLATAITAGSLAAYGLVAAGLASALRWMFHHAMAVVSCAAAIVFLWISMGTRPAFAGWAVWNEVGASFAAVAACLAMAAVLARYASSRAEEGRALAIGYELGAIGVAVMFYFIELLRAADGLYMPVFDDARAMYAGLFAVALAVVAAGLVVRGLWWGSVAHRVMGLAAGAAAIVMVLLASGKGRQTYERVLLHPRGAAYLLLIAAMVTMVWAYRRWRQVAADEARVIRPLLSVAVHAAALGCFTLEALDFWSVRAGPWLGENLLIAWYAKHATLSVGYAVYGFALLAGGLLWRSALARWTALVILAGTVVKVFAYDLSRLEALWRIGSFFCLGLMLLAGSTLYYRYRHVLAGAMPGTGDRERH